MNNNLKRAVALRKMIQDIVGINHSSILYLVYILLSATAPSIFYSNKIFCNSISHSIRRN